MKYIVLGRCMAYLVFIVFKKSIENLFELTYLENFVGWFFIEHLFEEYAVTAGKFFLTDNDFRTLLINFFSIIENLFLFSKILIPTELFIINLLFIYIIFYLNKKKFKFTIKVLILLFYIIFVKLVFFINFVYREVWVISIFLTCIFFIFFYKMLKLNSFIKQKFVKITVIKFILYFSIVVFKSLIYLYFIKILVTSYENFIQEEIFIFIIPYCYFYYLMYTKIICVKKCLQ